MYLQHRHHLGSGTVMFAMAWLLSPQPEPRARAWGWQCGCYAQSTRQARVCLGRCAWWALAALAPTWAQWGWADQSGSMICGYYARQMRIASGNSSGLLASQSPLSPNQRALGICTNRLQWGDLGQPGPQPGLGQCSYLPRGDCAEHTRNICGTHARLLAW